MAVALTAIGGVISAVGAMQSANAQAEAANYNAAISDRNAIVAEQNRQLNLRTADIDAADKRRENTRNISAMRAAYGASGLELAGSPLDVLTDSATEMELDASRIEYEGRVRSREGALEVLGLRERSTLSRMEAKNAKTAGYLGAASSLVNAGSKMVNKSGSSLI